MTAVTQLLATMPHFICSFFIVGAVPSLFFGEMVGLLVILGWVASGALVFHRPTERMLARRVFRLRQPTPDEFAYLAPIWVEVSKRARVDHTVYELWIEDSDEINACAAVGHLVGVTRRSFTDLPPGQLAAVLAHELGHHVGGHPWARVAGFWYALPARVTWRVLSFLVAVAMMIALRLSLKAFLAVALVCLTFVGAALVFMPLLFVPLLLSPYIVAAADRAGELRADRKAAELGFAPSLCEVLRKLELEDQAAQQLREEETSGDRPQRKRVNPLLSSHPSTRKRLKRLTPYLSSTG